MDSTPDSDATGPDATGSDATGPDATGPGPDVPASVTQTDLQPTFACSSAGECPAPGDGCLTASCSAGICAYGVASGSCAALCAGTTASCAAGVCVQASGCPPAPTCAQPIEIASTAPAVARGVGTFADGSVGVLGWQGSGFQSARGWMARVQGGTVLWRTAFGAMGSGLHGGGVDAAGRLIGVGRTIVGGAPKGWVLAVTTDGSIAFETQITDPAGPVELYGAALDPLLVVGFAQASAGNKPFAARLDVNGKVLWTALDDVLGGWEGAVATASGYLLYGWSGTGDAAPGRLAMRTLQGGTIGAATALPGFHPVGGGARQALAAGALDVVFGLAGYDVGAGPTVASTLAVGSDAQPLAANAKPLPLGTALALPSGKPSEVRAAVVVPGTGLLQARTWAVGWALGQGDFERAFVHRDDGAVVAYPVLAGDNASLWAVVAAPGGGILAAGTRQPAGKSPRAVLWACE